MRNMNPICCTRAIGSSVVLLARIVDGAGRPILLSQVAAIEYKVFERGPCRSKHFATGAERPAVHLEVSDVLSPTLVNDGSWSVDVGGYNFRHHIAIGEGVVTPTMGGHIELWYVFSSTDGMKSIIRFTCRSFE